MKKFALFVYSIILLIKVPFSAIIYVPSDVPTIQGAIDSASTGDTILVLPGQYYENIRFDGKNVTLGSLYLLTGDTSYIHQTIIDGNENGSVITFDSNEDSTCRIIGFTIQRGFGGENYDDKAGGGITCINSSPGIENLIIKNNRSIFGGGIYCDSSHIVISNSTITRNKGFSVITHLSEGAGIFITNRSKAKIIKSNIYHNIADTTYHLSLSGGIHLEDSSSAFISKCKIYDNVATGAGGIGSYESFLNIDSSIIACNSSLENGGGIDMHSTNAFITNSFIYNNTAGYNGGGIYSFNGHGDWYYYIYLDRNYIYKNRAEIQGGAVYSEFTHQIVLRNCTIANNYTGYECGGIYFRHGVTLMVINTILFYNDLYEIQAMRGGMPTNLLIANSDIEGSTFHGIYYEESTTTLLYYMHNFSQTPLFIDTTNSNYQISESSPCVDAGTNFLEWDGDTLIYTSDYNGIAPDMGAFESPFSTSINREHFQPREYILFQNHPNPFNTITYFSFILQKSAYVNLSIYDIEGRKVEVVLNGFREAGYYSIPWSTEKVSSGIYFYKLTTDKQTITKKCLLLK